ncbi:MAG: hypothetical protein GY696_02270, partial [Gammaproteobacteria bacterium]|nr:hypothetical protein [Gammaproteobacteria bacterium]
MVSPLRRQICLNPVWRVGSEDSRSEPERPEAERSEAAGPEPTQPNWIETNLAPRGETKPVGLIESGGAPPQTPGRLRRKIVAGGSAPRP